MKNVFRKIIVGFLVVSMFACSQFIVFATEPASEEKGDAYDTIILPSSDVDLSQYGVTLTRTNTIISAEGADPADNNPSRGILCTLLGHNWGYSYSVLAIVHNVRPRTPKCDALLYDVYKCARCDESDWRLIATGTADCH